jgi:hypothetical protein
MGIDPETRAPIGGHGHIPVEVKSAHRSTNGPRISMAASIGW